MRGSDVAFGISGFGAPQVAASPQIFQALSIGGRVPQAPSPPYGTPNQSLVPVGPAAVRAFPANLTLAAQPVFDALVRAGQQTPLDLAHPPVQGLPNTTAALAATNPAVTFQLQGPAPSGVGGLQNLPQGPVSFRIGAPSGQPVTLTAIARAAADAQSALRQSTLATRSLTSIVQTVQSLAALSVYPAPVFSFHA